MTLSGSANFVWLQSPPWDSLWTRQNHFVLRLAPSLGSVLYVENNRSFSQELRRLVLRPKMRREGEIYILKLPIHIPGGRSIAVIARLNFAIQAFFVRRTLKKLGWSEWNVWCRLPRSFHVAKRIGYQHLIYDVTDRYEFYEKTDRNVKLTARAETLMISHASKIFCTTENLRRYLYKKGAKKNSVKVIPNGVELSFFDYAKGVEAYPSNKPIKDLTIIYMGLIAEWMDFDLIQEVANELPGQLTLVGPVTSAAEQRLYQLDNVLVAPAVPYHKVPEILSDYDVCFIPHLPLPVRNEADPLKLMEYFALGKPVLSTRLGNILQYDDLVFFGSTCEEILDQLHEIVHASEDAAEKRIAAMRNVAASRSWDELYTQVATELNRLN